MVLFATSYVGVERDCVTSRKRKFEDRLLEGSRYHPSTGKQPKRAPESLKGADVTSKRRQANRGSKDTSNTRHPLIDLTLVDSSGYKQEGNKGRLLTKEASHPYKKSSPARDSLGEERPSKRFNLEKALRQADDYYREKRRSTELKTVDPLEELFGEELPDIDFVPVRKSHRHENVTKISKVLGSCNEQIVEEEKDEPCNEKKSLNEQIVVEDELCDGKKSLNEPIVVEDELCNGKKSRNEPIIVEDESCDGKKSRNEPIIVEDELCDGKKSLNEPIIVGDETCNGKKSLNEPIIVEDETCNGKKSLNEPIIVEDEPCNGKKSRNEPIIVEDESCNGKKSLNEPIVVEDELCDGKKSLNEPIIVDDESCGGKKSRNEPIVVEDELCDGKKSRNEPIVVDDESCDGKKPCEEPIVVEDKSCDGKQPEILTNVGKRSKEPVQGPLTLKQRQFVDSLFEDTPPRRHPPSPHVTRDRKCLTELMKELEKDSGTAKRDSNSDSGHNSSLSSRKSDDVTIPSKVLAQRQLVNIKQKLLSSLSGIASKETCSLAVKKSYEGSLSKRQLTPVRELSTEPKSHNLASRIEIKFDKKKAAKNNTNKQETGQRRSHKNNSSAVRKCGEGTLPKHITSPVRDLLAAQKKQSPVTKSEGGSMQKRSSSPVRNLNTEPKSNKIINTKFDANKTERETKKPENIQSTYVSAPNLSSAIRSTSDTSQAEKMICSTNFRKSFSTFKIPRKPKQTDSAVDQLKTVSSLTLREVTPAWVSTKTSLLQGNGRYCPC